MVERNKNRAKNISRFPLTNRYVGEVKDYAGVAREEGITFRAAWLDYCGPVSQSEIDDAIAVMPLVHIGGMLILTFLAVKKKPLPYARPSDA